MAFWSGWFNRPSSMPRAAVQDAGGGVLITTSDQLDEYLKSGSRSKSGAVVTSETALQVAAVYACVRIICGAVATMPLDIKRRVDDRTREDASDTQLWRLIRRRPNGWQKPAQFRRLLQAHVLLRGNAFCHVVRSRGEIIQLLPLHPDRMKVEQQPDLSLKYKYQRKNGVTEEFSQREIFHLFGLTLDGITGVTPITYARETIGLSLSMEDHGASTFKNGMRASGVLTHPDKLGEDSRQNLKDSLAEYRAGGDSEGLFLILEEGMVQSQLKMTAQDSQWIESRKFSRTDIAMFFGVPPHMIGDTEKSTSWGSGIEQQKDGFVTFTLDDHLTMWEEGITIDLASDERIYAKFNRNALVKGNIKDRTDAYAKALGVGGSPAWMEINEVRAREEMNPVEWGNGKPVPPAATGNTTKPADQSKETGDDDPQDA
jgi:HK97 family phage portal protein